MCDCKVGPGKFEGEPALTFLAWDATIEGGGDATTGSGENGTLTEWLRRYSTPRGAFDFSAGTIAAARGYGYCEPCIREALDSTAGGVAVWETEQGFVCGTEFATVEEFEAALAEAEADDAANARPEVHVFELTAAEVAERDEDTVHEYMKRAELRLATFNSRDRGLLLDAMVTELGIKGGWYYQLSDGETQVDEGGPFGTSKEARAAGEQAAEEWS